jgi:hypothetical protein
MIPVWSFVSLHSTNILKDAVIYDAMLIIIYPLLIGYLSGELLTLSLSKAFGLLCVVFGLLLFLR